MTKCKLAPLGDRLAVKRDESESKSKGGILLPDTAQKKAKTGLVLAAGPGKWDAATRRHQGMEAKPGHTVVFGSYSGTETEIDGESYLILTEDDILAVVN